MANNNSRESQGHADTGIYGVRGRNCDGRNRVAVKGEAGAGEAGEGAGAGSDFLPECQ